jgi:hypothetical protein
MSEWLVDIIRYVLLVMLLIVVVIILAKAAITLAVIFVISGAIYLATYFFLKPFDMIQGWLGAGNIVIDGPTHIRIGPVWVPSEVGPNYYPQVAAQYKIASRGPTNFVPVITEMKALVRFGDSNNHFDSYGGKGELYGLQDNSSEPKQISSIPVTWKEASDAPIHFDQWLFLPSKCIKIGTEGCADAPNIESWIEILQSIRDRSKNSETPLDAEKFMHIDFGVFWKNEEERGQNWKRCTVRLDQNLLKESESLLKPENRHNSFSLLDCVI